ncbi:MAG: UDP-N-acetylglucosamine 2-epimerase [Syntrophobacteraceae bacterium]|jgi:UDP-N-acetylglucosamine 2-epimerase (non-hydrolysing)
MQFILKILVVTQYFWPEEFLINDFVLGLQALNHEVEVLNGLAERFRKHLIVSTHPRTRKRIEAEGVRLNPLIELFKPLGFCDYVKLQKHAYCVLSDSGTITEESSILNFFPALNIRNAHERPEGFEEGSVILTGLHLPTVLQALDVLEVQPRGGEPMLRIVDDYPVPNVGEKVVRIIISCIGYINRVVWHRG